MVSGEGNLFFVDMGIAKKSEDIGIMGVIRIATGHDDRKNQMISEDNRFGELQHICILLN